MQLFTIGLNLLQPDGTLKLDANGLPIPTYSQTDITNFAHVFTGWNTDPTPVVIPTLTTTGTVNVNSSYNKPMTVVSNGTQHSHIAKTLLSYTQLNGQPGPNATIAANRSSSSREHDHGAQPGAG